jgi:cytosine/adenosine deaminase-related metal-dependent hydrolase
MHRALLGRFPIKVLNRFGYSHSLHVDGQRVANSHHETPSDWPWMIHAAEGTDEAAQSEIAALDRLGCLTGNTVLIHGVALCPNGRQRVIDAGAGLVWCPSSNRFLFNTTADVRSFDDADRLALGSDSRLSGERDLLDELRVAHESHQLSAEGLARVVTSGAARLLRLSDAGRIATGLPADLVVLRANSSDPFASLIEATRTDVRLTMVDGVPVAGDASLAPIFTAAGVATMAARLDGTPRVVAKWIGRRVAAMKLQEPGFEVVH